MKLSVAVLLVACIALRSLTAHAADCAPAGDALSIRVCGNRLIDAKAQTVQLRGVNVSGLEAVAVMGWSPDNPWGAQTGTDSPDFKVIKKWGVNVVRLPMNEASWLGLSCVDAGGFGWSFVGNNKVRNARGAIIKADPGGNYPATVKRTVAEATKAGLYVILDLHLTAPGNACPTVQNAMADQDHSIAFWSSVASTFKSAPNVMFELFNEPFLDMTKALKEDSPWQVLRDGGGTMNSYITQSSTAPYQIMPSLTWKTAGHQQMLDAVRATGATNVVLTSSLSYASAIFNWLQYKPADPAGQLAAVWHAYADEPYPAQVNCVGMPGCSAKVMSASQAIRDAGFPVVITEFGDPIGKGKAPWSSVLLPFADANGFGYLGWTWDVWPDQKANVLIKDADGTPSPGYGEYVKAHLLCRAAGSASCP